MTRFKDLLTLGQHSTPKEEQLRASAELADAVSASNLRRWEGRGALPAQGQCLLLAVAPYSQYDLAVLDILDERLGLGQSPAIPVYVVNLLESDPAALGFVFSAWRRKAQQFLVRCCRRASSDSPPASRRSVSPRHRFCCRPAPLGNDEGERRAGTSPCSTC
jgi:hypothetical protein